jgi:hypothetical protein
LERKNIAIKIKNLKDQSTRKKYQKVLPSGNLQIEKFETTEKQSKKIEKFEKIGKKLKNSSPLNGYVRFSLQYTNPCPESGSGKHFQGSGKRAIDSPQGDIFGHIAL